MKKKVLYISKFCNNTSPVGVRHLNYIKHLRIKNNPIVLDLASKSFFYANNTTCERIVNLFIRKLPLLPDTDILILNKYKKAIIKTLSQNKFKTVIIGILPFSFLYLTKFIKNLNKDLNIIVDMSDPISANMSFRFFSKTKQNFLLKLERKYLPYIDMLIVLNDEIKQYYKGKYKNLNRVIVIEQGIDQTIIEQNSYNIEINEIHLIYAGHLYKGDREPYELYNAIETVAFNIQLYIYGQFKKSLYPPQTDKFYYGERISRDELKQKYSESNIVVFIDNKDSLQVPGKTMEILALNKPVLFIYFSDESPTLQYVTGYKGIYLTKNNSEEIKCTIETIISDNCYYYKRDLSMFYWKNLLTRVDKFL